MNKTFLLLLSAMIFLFTPLSAHAKEIPFPKGWETWVKIRTRLSSISALPSCEADVALLPWDDLPWDEMAFTSVTWALEKYRAGGGPDMVSAPPGDTPLR